MTSLYKLNKKNFLLTEVIIATILSLSIFSGIITFHKQFYSSLKEEYFLFHASRVSDLAYITFKEEWYNLPPSLHEVKDLENGKVVTLPTEDHFIDNEIKKISLLLKLSKKPKIKNKTSYFLANVEVTLSFTTERKDRHTNYSLILQKNDV